MIHFSNAWKMWRPRVPRIGTFSTVTMLWFFFVTMAWASVDEARTATRSDIETARTALAAQREEIAAARAEWSKAYMALEQDVRALRTEWRDVQRATTRREAERAAERRRADAVASEHRAWLSMLGEYRRAVEQHMSAPQVLRYAPLLEALDAALAEDESSGTSLDAVAPAWALSMAVAWQNLSSRPFDGYAVDEEGLARQGRYVSVGPALLFVGDEAGVTGHVGPGGVDPVLAVLRPMRVHRALQTWAEGHSALAPMDPSNGALLRIVAARLSLADRLRQGGVVMIPLLCIGLLCVVVGVQRFIALRRMETNTDTVVDQLLEALRSGDETTARATADAATEPWRALWCDAVSHWRVDRAYLEEILQDRIVMQGPRVMQYLSVLAMGAAAAPLLGLLGTVTGMIHTFQLITIFGTGDARSLSSGISEALITTQVGLVIAVPALLAHAYLMRRAKAILSALEQGAVRFIRQLPPGA